MNKLPITFKQVQEWIKNKQFNKFYRSTRIQKKYDLEREQAVKNLKAELDEVGQDFRKKWVLRKNDYPYYLEKGLKYWIVWNIEPRISWKLLELSFPSWLRYPSNPLFKNHYSLKKYSDQIVWWINPPQFRSVNDIPHVHLVRKVATKEAKNE